MPGFAGLFLREVVFRVQRNHVTSAIPTFCLVCQDEALCWRNCEGPGQGGASDIRLYVASVLVADRNVNTAAMHLEKKTQPMSLLNV